MRISSRPSSSSRPRAGGGAGGPTPPRRPVEPRPARRRPGVAAPSPGSCAGHRRPTAGCPLAAGRRSPAPAPPATAPRSAATPPGTAGGDQTGPSTERATAILAAGTFASRLTGFLRVLTIGYVLGVTSLSDAFNYANGIPNIIYDLLLGGILSATLIPVFVEQLREEDRAENMRASRPSSPPSWPPWPPSPPSCGCSPRSIIHFYLLLNPAAHRSGRAGPGHPAAALTSPRRSSSSAPSWCRPPCSTPAGTSPPPPSPRSPTT